MLEEKTQQISLLREELYNLRHDMQRLKRIEDDISAIRYYLVLKK